MTRFLCICSLLLSPFIGFTQSLTGPSSMTSGNSLLLTASGESNSSYISFVMFKYGESSIVSPSDATLGQITVNGPSITQMYNPTSKTPTKFTVTLSSSYPAAVTVKLAFEVQLISYPNSGSSVTKVLYHTVTINPRPAPTVYHSEGASQKATRNNCGTGFSGWAILYEVPAGKYTSTISQEDANKKAWQDVADNAYTYANQNAACSDDAIVKTPKGASDYSGEEQDIVWAPSYFPGTDVKIERYHYDIRTKEKTLLKVIAESTPNDGLLEEGLKAGPESTCTFIRVTSISTGKLYETGTFFWTRD